MNQNIMDQIPTLVKHCATFEDSIVAISDRWVHYPMVEDVLNKYEINTEYFKNEYALKVLEYYFGVIKNTNEIGNCPVIKKLLNYLKEKDVSTDELFIICTHGRKSMLDEVVKQQLLSPELISEISFVFDLNFKGVLKEYSETIFRLQQQVNQEMEKGYAKDLLLVQQSRMAKMGELISMIAHQWRQPLGIIAANTIDLKLQSEFDSYDLKSEEGAKAYQSYINEGLDNTIDVVQNLTKIIDDFKSFNEPDYQAVQISLNSLCQRAKSIIETTLMSDNLNISYELNSEETFEIYINEMIQVVIDIVKNAQENFQALSIEDAHITISANKNVLTICDNGGGMPEESLGKIFEPYFSTKDEKNGKGLGLYISKNIVESHHSGKLKVKNGPNGLCFTIELPAIE